MNKQKGFTVVEGLLIALVVAVLGFGGYYVWNQQKKSDNKSSQASEQTTSDTSSGETPAETDPTADWQTYTDAYAKYTVKFPKDWVRQTENAELCSEGLVLLASEASRLGRCASDSGGEALISATLNKNVVSEYELTTKYYPDLKETEVKLNGVTGTRQVGTFNKDGSEDFGIGPEDGQIDVKYLFFKDNNTYVASYSLPKNSKNNIATFDLIVTKGFTF